MLEGCSAIPIFTDEEPENKRGMCLSSGVTQGGTVECWESGEAGGPGIQLKHSSPSLFPALERDSSLPTASLPVGLSLTLGI